MLTKNITPISKQSLSKTVFLPKTKFPSRHDPKTELKIQEEPAFALDYLEQDRTRKSYVIHDGPPFANGQIHLGHAVNKILKDIAARYAKITGNCVEFITGWDCHGLPIESQVLKMQHNPDCPKTFRAAARQYAKSQIDLQLASFKRIGLLTDWNKRYTTDDPSYIANQLRAFCQLYQQKLIFTDLMPVNWSITNQNTLADADVDYRPTHVSRAAYVLYEVVNHPFPVEGNVYGLIWTTTPWTILENEAIAFNKQHVYCIVKIFKPASSKDDQNLLLSLESLPKLEVLLQRLGYQYTLKTQVPGQSLAGIKYKPLLETLLPSNGERGSEPRPFLEAHFVDGSKGTGLVHISPNYGLDDYNLIKKNSLPIRTSLVGPDGNFDNQVSQLANLNIFSAGNTEILNLLDQHNALLFSETYQHSYPYETRTNSPIITKTSQQIFLDTARIIPRCIKALESCSFFPENRKTQFINTLKDSPSWCISRQRLWGIPIPVCYDIDDVAQKNTIVHPMLIEHFCKKLYKTRTMDYWWTMDNSELFPQELLDSCKLPCKSENLVRGKDIFDVWSDSGLSWHTITNNLKDTNQSDLYLEGVDQIRGWFSSSSLLSMALRGTLPTKRFFIHGFTLDEMGRKMSKSRGNVIDPIELFDMYGVDPIRIWAAKRAGNHCDISVRMSDFEGTIEETVHRFRSTLKFLIGCLQDHEAVEGEFDHTKLDLFDQYYLDKLYNFSSAVDTQYRNYRYHEVISTISEFIQYEWSPIYITSIKDQLYCDELDSYRRKSCLIILNLAYNIFLRCLYPIVPHIVHEASRYMRCSEPLNNWQNLGHKASWSNNVLSEQFDILVSIRKSLSKSLGHKWDDLKNYNAILHLNDKKVSRNLHKITQPNPDLIAQLFNTSTFNVNIDDGHNVIADFQVDGIAELEGSAPTQFNISFSKSINKKCPRCRRFCLSDGSDFCDRCVNAMNNKR